MIPFNSILAWQVFAPWGDIDLVEQDLVLSRAVVDIFSDPEIQKKIAFRGGTALNKIFFKVPARFSEDIDLVQIQAEPIGETLDNIRSRLDPWLGSPKRSFNEGRATLTYHYTTEETQTKVKLKVEINTREHGAKYGYEKYPFKVKNNWFSHESLVTTYCLEELLGTKIRALYQRKKGRDLFDLWYAKKIGTPDFSKSLLCFEHYITNQGVRVLPSDFRANIEEKINGALFLKDMDRIINPSLIYTNSDAKIFANFLIDLFVATFTKK